MVKFTLKVVWGTIAGIAVIIGAVSAILGIYSASTDGPSISVFTIFEPKIEINLNPDLERQLLDAARKYNQER